MSGSSVISVKLFIRTFDDASQQRQIEKGFPTNKSIFKRKIAILQLFDYNSKYLDNGEPN